MTLMFYRERIRQRESHSVCLLTTTSSLASQNFLSRVIFTDNSCSFLSPWSVVALGQHEFIHHHNPLHCPRFCDFVHHHNPLHCAGLCDLFIITTPSIVLVCVICSSSKTLHCAGLCDFVHHPNLHCAGLCDLFIITIPCIVLVCVICSSSQPPALC